MGWKSGRKAHHDTQGFCSDVRFPVDNQYSITFSCDPGTVSYGGHHCSVYTAAFLQNIEELLPFDRILTKTREILHQEAMHMQRSWTLSCLVEDIYLYD